MRPFMRILPHAVGMRIRATSAQLAPVSADPNEPPAQPTGPARLQVQRRSTATRYRVYAPTGFR